MDQTKPIPGADPKLRALIEQIVQQATEDTVVPTDTNRQPSTLAVVDSSEPCPPPLPPSQLTIDQQITQLRKQLSDSYNLFMGARDTLAGISFLKLDQQMASKTAAAMAAASAQVDAATNSLEFGDETVSFLTSMRHRVTDSPEVATFFRVVARLQQGIARMEVNHRLMSDLNRDVDGAVSADRAYVDDVRKRLDEKVSADELALAERMVDEAIAAEK